MSSGPDGRRDLGDPVGNVVQRPGEDAYLVSLPVNLDADAVDLPLDGCRADPCHGRRNRRCRTREHGLDRTADLQRYRAQARLPVRPEPVPRPRLPLANRLAGKRGARWPRVHRRPGRWPRSSRRRERPGAGRPQAGEPGTVVQTGSPGASAPPAAAGAQFASPAPACAPIWPSV